MNNRGVSISTGFNKDMSFQEQLPLIKHAGFTHVALHYDLLKSQGFLEGNGGILSNEGYLDFKQQLYAFDLKVDALHGGSFDEPHGVERISALIELASDLKVDTIILHPYRGFETFPSKLTEKMERILEVGKAVQPLLEKHKVRVAIENLHPEHMETLLAGVLGELDPNYFGFCYNLSHDQMDGPRELKLLNQFESRIFLALFSDRSGAYVDHLLPGEGYVFFADVCKTLRLQGYNRPIFMDVKMDQSMYKDPELFLNKAFQSGRMLMNQICPIKKK